MKDRDGEWILEAEGLTKTYRSGERSLDVLREVSFRLGAGETMAIVGPSGSGKTTLLGLCAGLDAPTRGRVRLAGMDLGSLDEDGRARARNLNTGFVFQSFQLIPTLTALENVMVPMELRGERGGEKAARRWLEEVGLGERLQHYPAQLSGGEQQRVAIARAFVTRPKVLFADEPTGNLDTDTGHRIVERLFDLNTAAGTALVLVTHDLELAGRTRRILRLRGGEVVEDTARVAAAGDGRGDMTKGVAV
ncbi:MAG: ABC transporter ATP-binding protein [Verrucomicrobiae bacterium]|nr:ABC transporter ATP-binding protein [Verrucomicrobiae bacterium]